MAIEASFTVTERSFPLSVVFDELPGAQIELDRVVPTSDAIIPYFWVGDPAVDGLDATEIGHPGVKDIRVIDHVDGQALLRVEWDFEYESVLTAILETDITLLSAIGKRNKWTFEIRGDDQQAISAFHTYCLDNDVPMKLTQLHALSPLRLGEEYDLTADQREALTLAYARGYFDSPREASQREIAAELGISRQSLSSRLQRGTRRLVASTLISPD